jgi:hypothetical protein
MARVATPNLSLGTWLDGENPGAGSQTVDSTGLNGNAIKLDTAVGVAHTTAGAHKSGVIDGPNLAATAVDASSIQLAGAPLKLSVKALGIVASMIAAGAVIAGKLADGAVEQASRIADGIITGAKLAAGTITTDKIASGGVQTANIADANVTTAKLEYKEYVAIISQAGTSAPSVTVIKNTLGGTIVWTRSLTGVYLGTLAGAFTTNKTIGLITGWGLTGNAGTNLPTTDVFYIITGNYAGSYADGVLNNHTLLIRVYP